MRLSLSNPVSTARRQEKSSPLRASCCNGLEKHEQESQREFQCTRSFFPCGRRWGPSRPLDFSPFTLKKNPSTPFKITVLSKTFTRGPGLSHWRARSNLLRCRVRPPRISRVPLESEEAPLRCARAAILSYGGQKGDDDDGAGEKKAFSPLHPLRFSICPPPLPPQVRADTFIIISHD